MTYGRRLALFLGASSSRRPGHAGGGVDDPASPSSWGRVHRGLARCIGTAGDGRLALFLGASSSRRPPRGPGGPQLGASPSSWGRVHRGPPPPPSSRLGGASPSSWGRVHRGMGIQTPPVQASASPSSWGRVHRGVAAASSRLSLRSLALFLGASSSRPTPPPSSRLGGRASPSSWGRVHRGVLQSGVVGGVAKPRPLPGGEFIEAAALAWPARSSPKASPSSWGRVHRGCRFATSPSARARPRPLPGGEFIEACSSATHAPEAPPRPLPGGEFIEAATRSGARPSNSGASPSSWGRVHRGEVRLLGSRGGPPRPLPGGEFIEAAWPVPPRAGTDRLALFLGASSSRPPHPVGGGWVFPASPSSWGRVHRGTVPAGTTIAFGVPRPLPGGEFIEARRERPPRHRTPDASPSSWGRVHRGYKSIATSVAELGLALFLGASSSRHRPRVRERLREVASPSSWGRVHRGSDKLRAPIVRTDASPSSWGRVHRGRADLEDPEALGGLALFLGASSSRRSRNGRRRWRPWPRPLPGGEFIEAFELFCNAPGAPASPSSWGRVHRGPPRGGRPSPRTAPPSSWGRVHRGYFALRVVQCSPRLALFLGASSSRLRGGLRRGAVEVASPSSWGRVHRGLLPRPPPPLSHTPRPLPGGEFIEA